MNPAALARQSIDQLLRPAGWTAQIRPGTDLDVAVCEFLFQDGEAGHLLFPVRKGSCVIEAKPAGMKLSSLTTLKHVQANLKRYKNSFLKADGCPQKPSWQGVKGAITSRPPSCWNADIFYISVNRDPSPN